MLHHDPDAAKLKASRFSSVNTSFQCDTFFFFFFVMFKVFFISLLFFGSLVCLLCHISVWVFFFLNLL